MLAIILVSYKNELKTVNYVRNELSKVTTPHKTIIVNNGATPESDNELAKRLQATIVRHPEENYREADCYILSNPVNSGFAVGNNLGAMFAKKYFRPDFLLFSNNDIRFLSDNVVEMLINTLEQTPEAGLIGPKVIGLQGELQSPEPYHSFWDRHVWMYLSTPFYSKAKKARRFQLNYAQTAQEGFHYKVMGSFFLARADDFYQCGMMDDHTFLYAEETILTERMKCIGKKVYYDPKIAVMHEHGATTSKHLNRHKMNDLLFQSECYYYQKYIKTPLWQLYVGKIVHRLRKFFT